MARTTVHLSSAGRGIIADTPGTDSKTDGPRGNAIYYMQWLTNLGCVNFL